MLLKRLRASRVAFFAAQRASMSSDEEATGRRASPDDPATGAVGLSSELSISKPREPLVLEAISFICAMRKASSCAACSRSIKVVSSSKLLDDGVRG